LLGRLIGLLWVGLLLLLGWLLVDRLPLGWVAVGRQLLLVLLRLKLLPLLLLRLLPLLRRRLLRVHVLLEVSF
jgi:hypothetical protein